MTLERMPPNDVAVITLAAEAAATPVCEHLDGLSILQPTPAQQLGDRV